MKAFQKDLEFIGSIAPAAHTSDVTGGSADLAARRAAMAIVHAGVRTDGTHTPKLQDSPDDSAWTDVAAGLQDGTFAAIASNVDQKVAYMGTARYLRVFVTVSGATTGAVYDAMIITLPKKEPKA